LLTQFAGGDDGEGKEGGGRKEFFSSHVTKGDGPEELRLSCLCRLKGRKALLAFLAHGERGGRTIWGERAARQKLKERERGRSDDESGNGGGGGRTTPHLLFLLLQRPRAGRADTAGVRF